tara:strand:- start:4378 stop:5040 length:663 start_codon:yes stop_codon:yes gene_type:complete
MINISVLVPVYNDEKYIGRCLRSLLNQTLFNYNYEIIIINDGSTDRTSYAIELFKKPKEEQVRIITNQKNLGLPASLNLGIKAAKGRYIVRVDSDDYVNVNFLSILSFYLDIYNDIGGVACDYILVDQNENNIEIVNSKKLPIACGIMFRKENLVNIGMYDIKFRCQEDEDLRIRFLEKYKIDNINLPLYRYRRHTKNMTNDKELLVNYEKLLIEKHTKK